MTLRASLLAVVITLVIIGLVIIVGLRMSDGVGRAIT